MQVKEHLGFQVYSKQDQTKQRCRLRPKPSQKNKTKTTYEDKVYLEWFANTVIPCFCCGTLKDVRGHHIKEHSTDKKDHHSLLPLCDYCHTGATLSPHGTPKKWKQRYSIEIQRMQGKMYYQMFLDESV